MRFGFYALTYFIGYAGYKLSEVAIAITKSGAIPKPTIFNDTIMYAVLFGAFTLDMIALIITSLKKRNKNETTTQLYERDY